MFVYMHHFVEVDTLIGYTMMWCKKSVAQKESTRWKRE